jgi:tight adherence protein B
MFASALLPIVAFLLTAGCVGGVLVAGLYPRLAGGSSFERRFQRIAVSGGGTGRSSDSPGDKARKRSVESTLQDADEQQKAKSLKRYKPLLATRLRQADIAWTTRTYYLICLGVGAASFLMFLSIVGLLPAIGFGVAGALLLPRLYVGSKRRRRFERFRKAFPDAIDVMVRGIKSGVPVADCMKVVAVEAIEPVKGEFKTIIEDQALGMPLGDACLRLPDRIPVAEAVFFAIVISVQTRAGGNLSEALGNLSNGLRQRKKMLSKIAAMSAEAKASGGIIGALPIVVGGILYFTAPDYIGLLFSTTPGNIVLAVSGLWMGLGILVMRKMINFDF